MKLKLWMMTIIILLGTLNVSGQLSTNPNNKTTDYFIEFGMQRDGVWVYAIKNPELNNKSVDELISIVETKFSNRLLNISHVNSPTNSIANIKDYMLVNITTQIYGWVANGTTNYTLNGLVQLNKTHMAYLDSDSGMTLIREISNYLSVNFSSGEVEQPKLIRRIVGNDSQISRQPLDKKMFLIPNQSIIMERVVTPKMTRLSNGWGWSINQTWWNATFTQRVNVTIDASMLAHDLTNHALLIRLNSSVINYSNTQDNGSDIRCVDADESTLLDYEIEVWNESGESIIWCEVPTITGGSTTDFVQLYFGCSSCDAGANPTGTWNSNYHSVYHMNEDPSINLSDSTANDHFGTPGGLDGFSSDDEVSGVVATGHHNNGTVVSGTQARSYVRVDAPMLNSSAQNFTIEYNAKVIPNSQRFAVAPIYMEADPSDIVGYFYTRITNPNEASLTLFWEDSSGTDIISGTTFNNVFDGTFKHYVITVNGTVATLYVNGEVNGTATRTVQGAVGYGVSDVWSQRRGTDPNEFPVNGTLDELRLRTDVATPSEVNFTYQELYNGVITYGGIENFVATPPANNTCTYTSGDWLIQCSDNCLISQTDVSNNDVRINGSGTMKWIRNITNANITIIGGCSAYA